MRTPAFKFGRRRLALPLTSRRLRFVPPNARYTEELLRLLNEPTVVRWTLRIPSPYRRRDAREFLRRAAAARRAGTDLSLHLIERATGRLVGGIGLHHLESPEQPVEIGYWIGRPFRRRGYASEAVERLARAAFGPLGIHRLTAHIFPYNRASMGVVRRAGFRREGHLRASIQKNGRWLDEVVFARLASDPRPRGGRRPSPR